MHIAYLQNAVENYLICRDRAAFKKLCQATRRVDAKLARNIMRKELIVFEFIKSVNESMNKSIVDRITFLNELTIPSYGNFHLSSPSCKKAVRAYRHVLETLKKEADFVHLTTGCSLYNFAVNQHIVLMRLKLHNARLRHECM